MRCVSVSRYLTIALALVVFGSQLLVADDDSMTVTPAPWFRLGAELRTRGEADSSSTSGEQERTSALVSRIRFSTQLAPASWFRLTTNFEDARTLIGSEAIVDDIHDNHVSIRHVFAEFGAGENGAWNLRIGRQSLAFGDERLVGADSFWSNRSQRFDGVRGTLRRGRWRWDVFTARPVQIFPNRPDPINTSERLSGAYANWSNDSGGVIEPYLLWKRARHSEGNGSPVDNFDYWTPGLRLATPPLWLGFQALTEMATQRGNVAGAPVSAWAGYWELSRRMGVTETAPRLALSFSRASGGDLSDGRVRTFNDLNPAGYNGCGLLEPFSWRNIQDLRLASEWSLPLKWRSNVEFHKYWLASIKDGVYVDEGPYVAYIANATSSRLGSRIMAHAHRGFGTHFEFALGYAKFFAAPYMNSIKSFSHTVFLSWTLHT